MLSDVLPLQLKNNHSTRLDPGLLQGLVHTCTFFRGAVPHAVTQAGAGAACVHMRAACKFACSDSPTAHTRRATWPTCKFRAKPSPCCRLCRTHDARSVRASLVAIVEAIARHLGSDAAKYVVEYMPNVHTRVVVSILSHHAHDVCACTTHHKHRRHVRSLAAKVEQPWEHAHSRRHHCQVVRGGSSTVG